MKSSSHQSIHNNNNTRLLDTLRHFVDIHPSIPSHTNQNPHNASIMPLARRAAPRTTTRATRTSPRTARPSLKTRLLGGKTRRTTTRRTPATTTTTTTTIKTTRTTGGAHAAPVHHHKRHATMGDKVSGMMMKLRGSLTRRPGLKVNSSRSC